MSVELSGASSASQSAGGSRVGQGAHVKGKSHSAGGSDQADTGGFSSLLMNLGADEAGAAGSSPTSSDAAAQPQVDKGALLDPGLLLAQSMPLPPDLAKTISVPAKGKLAATQAPMEAVKTNQQRGVAALQAGLDAARQTDPVVPPAEQGPGKLTAITDAGQQGKKELQLVLTPKALEASDASQPVTGRLAAEEFASKLLHVDNSLAQSSASPQMVVAAGIGEPGTKQAERATEKSTFRQIGGSEGGMWGYQALAAAGRIDPPAPTAGASVLSPEMTVAEQVNYWIGRDVQNAELKLDGLGDSPVKVSISLQGNEAHIEFRTDQAQARQVLEGAVSHLKDLLGNEGLVLSSVSVGSSRSGADDPREKKTPQQSRQVALTVSAARVGETAQRPVRLSGRTVDLFV